jgi:integrase
MEKFIKVLDSMNTNTIMVEIQGKRNKDSKTLNDALNKAFGVNAGFSKARLLKVWTDIINKASKPRDSSITRIWIRLFKSLDRIMKALYLNEGTMEVALSGFRKVVKDKFGVESEVYKQSIYNTGISREESQARKDEYKKTVNDRNKNRKDLQPIFVEEVLDIITQAKTSNNVYSRAIAVLLATGCRTIELFKISKFEEEKGNPDAIVIIGLAKDKENNRRITRPLVGLKIDEAITLINGIRSELNLTGSNQSITNRTNIPLNKEFKKIFGGDSDLTIHKCRYIYGNVAYILYGKPRKIPYESYIQEILGHANPESTKSYLGINIQSKQKVMESLPLDIKRLFEKEIKTLQEQVNKCCPKNQDVDLTAFKNTHRRTMGDDAKINNIVEALRVVKANGKKIRQNELRNILKYSAKLMSMGYQKAREMNIL